VEKQLDHRWILIASGVSELVSFDSNTFFFKRAQAVKIDNYGINIKD
jgi:hypothetical protein